MYKKQILWDAFTLKTPSYPGRSFFKTRMAGIEYSILAALVKSTRVHVRYRRNDDECIEVVFAIGKLARLIDDIQDESSIFISDQELFLILKGKSTKLYSHPLINDLCKTAKQVSIYINHSTNKKKYWYWMEYCFHYQAVSNICRQQKKLLSRTLEVSEKIGGSVALSLIYAMDPVTLPKNIEKALFIAGSWIQAIDDFVDRAKDKRLGIFTIFTQSTNPEKTLDIVAKKYKKAILLYSKDTTYIIPLIEDLMALAKFSQFPICRRIFSAINA